MGYPTDTRCLVQYYGLPLLAILAVGTGLMASCIHANEDHCAISGGDFACEGSQICILERTETVESPADENGCYSSDDVPDGMVRVPFGVPKRFESSFSGDLDSVEGVLAAAAEERGLDISGCILQELRPTWSKLSEFVRDHIDRKARVSVSGFVLDDIRIQWIKTFNREVRYLLSEECVAMMPDTETGGTESDSDGTGSGGTDSDSDDSTTGPPVPCGQDNGECPESMPFCDPVTEQCVRCDDMPESDAACAGLDANNPLCFEGSCVACIDDETAACDTQGLLCDTNTMACVPCAEHSDCLSGACDLLLDIPTCFPENSVLPVGPNQVITTINTGLDAAALGEFDRVVIRLHGSGDSPPDFVESIMLERTDTKAIAFIAAEGDSPLWTRTGAMTGPILSVDKTNIRVYVDGLSLSESPSILNPGFACSGGNIDIRRSRVVNNQAGGIRATNGCTLSIQNSFIGGDISNKHAINIIDTSALDMLYTTVVAGSGTSSALLCSASSTVTVRNSILVSKNSDGILCMYGNLMNSATTATSSGSNTTVGAFHTNWFPDYEIGDFSLSLGNNPNDGQLVFADIATRQPGDPTTDIHGDPRPNAAGPDYPGADVPPSEQ